MKKWKTGVLFFTALTAALLSTAAAVQAEQQTMAGKLIRLHVVANSDSVEDQALKLQVRDAVLALTEPVTASDGNIAAELENILPQIKAAAESCLQAQGCFDPVQVSLGMEQFPTRVYEGFALPAGVYRSLRVTIGEGKGQNWWCVVFPSICFRATAAELEEAAEAAGLTPGEIRLITEDPEGYTLKFKTLELLQALKERLFR